MSIFGIETIESDFDLGSRTVEIAWLTYGPFVFWKWSAVKVKRCHDRDRSGAFLLASPIPFYHMWVFTELHFRAGTYGHGRFGPDPRELYSNVKCRAPRGCRV